MDRHFEMLAAGKGLKMLFFCRLGAKIN